MQRRTLLAVVGGSIPALAGCVSEESSDRESGSGDDGAGGGGDDDSSESDDDDGGNGDEALQFVEHEWYNNGPYDAGVTGQLENTSGEELSYVEVTVYFLDEDGVQIADWIDNTMDLAADRVWEFDVMYMDDDPYRVDDYEIEWSVTNY
ncbi:FxLYD domain-containing protein [Halovivax gelatinilyticus]|uniref:FxLYD domain-containing protein n=1 Tax=Halovivax gelatinilyticus TaxID=2961597 RepID=UPI0020CA3A3E|nr:FxLYD domain-containing protein [Halovivax gelatinilyticus]